LKWCAECVLPDTRPNLRIEADGRCNACHANATKRETDWTQRERAFQAVVQHAKQNARGYDCVIPVSGGKDSTWQTIKCLEYGLRPLAVTWRPPGRTEIGRKLDVKDRDLIVLERNLLQVLERQDDQGSVQSGLISGYRNDAELIFEYVERVSEFLLELLGRAGAKNCDAALAAAGEPPLDDRHAAPEEAILRPADDKTLTLMVDRGEGD